ncbi:MAG: FAD-binding oxidoreductase [Actinobacteria bacterium]|nr:MAG: FAD-binding oxidoreductase [Actinomycetota bacterium]
MLVLPKFRGGPNVKNALIVLPHDPSWDDARLAWNLSADQQPAAVALPETAEDVQAVVRWSRKRGLRIAPQGTGHNALPLGSLAHTVLLKTERMRGVEIDPSARRARVEAGVLWGEVSDAAAEHGLAALAGSSADVGVVGYSLGGGVSWLGRRYGLAANSVTAIELVNAEGELVRADAEQSADLFWALRGGGGSFGVVTALEFTLYPIAEVYAGILFFPLERGAEVLRAWRRWVDTVPDEVTSVGRFLQFPPIPDIPEPVRGKSFVVVEATSLLGKDGTDELLRPLRALGPDMDTFATIPVQQLKHLHMDPEHPVPGHGDGMVLSDFNDAAIDALVRIAGAGSGSPLITVEVRHAGGALERKAPGAGALTSIDGQFLMFAAGMTPTPGHGAAVRAHVELVQNALAAWDSGRAYLNFAVKRERGERLFGDLTYRRLQTVKAAVDPDDVFRSNHPVRLPASEVRKAA